MLALVRFPGVLKDLTAGEERAKLPGPRVINLAKYIMVESFMAARAAGRSPRAERDRATLTVLISISLVTKDST